MLLTLSEAKAKLCDLCNQMRNCANQATLDKFWKWAGDNKRAMQNQNKRIAFRQEYCNPKEWKFIWKAFDKEVSTLWDSFFFFEFINWCSRQKGIHAEKYKNLMILETFAVFFTCTTPANPLPDIKIDDPQGALALVTAAANIFLFFF